MKRNNAFTLIELLVVIAIIALLWKRPNARSKTLFAQTIFVTTGLPPKCT